MIYIHKAARKNVKRCRHQDGSGPAIPRRNSKLGFGIHVISSEWDKGCMERTTSHGQHPQLPDDRSEITSPTTSQLGNSSTAHRQASEHHQVSVASSATTSKHSNLTLCLNLKISINNTTRSFFNHEISRIKYVRQKSKLHNCYMNRNYLSRLTCREGNRVSMRNW